MTDGPQAKCAPTYVHWQSRLLDAVAAATMEAESSLPLAPAHDAVQQCVHTHPLQHQGGAQECGCTGWILSPARTHAPTHPRPRTRPPSAHTPSRHGGRVLLFRIGGRPESSVIYLPMSRAVAQKPGPASTQTLPNGRPPRAPTHPCRPVARGLAPLQGPRQLAASVRWALLARESSASAADGPRKISCLRLTFDPPSQQAPQLLRAPLLLFALSSFHTFVSGPNHPCLAPLLTVLARGFLLDDLPRAFSMLKRG